jgi:uncharacterized membrane protein
MGKIGTLMVFNPPMKHTALLPPASAGSGINSQQSTTISMNTSDRLRTPRPTGHLNPLLCALALACLPLAATAQTYTLQEIAPPAGTERCTAQWLNNPGQVVGGTSVLSGTGKKASLVSGPAFFWENGHSVILSPLPGHENAEAHALSDTGLAVGSSSRVVDGRRVTRATAWVRSAAGDFAPLDLNALASPEAGWSFDEAWAVSQDGRYIGVEDYAYGGSILLELNEAGGLAGLHPLGVNVWLWEARSMTGSLLLTGDLNDKAFWWDWTGDTRVDLHGNLPGTSFGTALNSVGETAGVYRVDGANRPAFWTAGGQLVDIFSGTAAGGYALGLNDAGLVTGWATLKTGKRGTTVMAFLWHPSTGARDLNGLKSSSDTSGLVLNWAGRINEAGQILARGSSKTRSNVQVVLTPE